MGGLAYQEVLEERTHARDKIRAAEDDDAGLDFIQIALSCGIPAAAVGLGGGWWLMRRALAPVAQLTEAAEKMHADNLGQSLPRSGNNDEIDRLVQVFNAMSARLRESFARVREFTLHASHELKTPITILHAEIENALATPALPEAQREMMENQLDELQRLAKIVDALTFLAKADAGLVSLDFAATRFDELVQDSVEDARILGQEREIEFTLLECEETTLRGDRHRLRQLLLNLTDNAVKHSQRGAKAAVSLTEKNGFAELTVANSGPGIPEEACSRVFDRFFRGNSAHPGMENGCGLGLSIAHWIVGAHGGRVNFESRPEGPTTVRVLLPIVRSAEPVRRPHAEEATPVA
jgi:signal transduction histidine kinase